MGWPNRFWPLQFLVSDSRLTDNTYSVPSVSAVSYLTYKITRPLAQRLTFYVGHALAKCFMSGDRT